MALNVKFTTAQYMKKQWSTVHNCTLPVLQDCDMFSGQLHHRQTTSDARPDTLTFGVNNIAH